MRNAALIPALLTLLCLLVFDALRAHAEPQVPAACDKTPLVYSRQPRLKDKIEQAGFATIGEGANWQRHPEAGSPDRHTEEDAVIDDGCGNAKVIYNCTLSPDTCAAYDLRPSPDNKLIAFTVARGASLRRVKSWADGPWLPEIEFNAISYEIWIHDVATGLSKLLENNARQGEWVTNAELVFASSRANTWPAWAHHGNDYKMRELNVYRGLRVDGKPSTIVNLTPGKFCWTPSVMTNGDIIINCWNGRDPKKLGTPANSWWPEKIRGNGAEHVVLANAHGSTTLKTTEHLVGVVDPRQQGVRSTQFRVVRPCTEVRPGIIICTNYYRNNHVGAMGILFGMDYLEPYEGFAIAAHIREAAFPSPYLGSGALTPQVRTLTPFGHDGDDAFRRDLKGRIMGKAGYAAPAGPEGEYLFTAGIGTCYEGTMPGETTMDYTGGIPTCQLVPMLAKRAVITDLFDDAQAERIACPGEQWNCRDARYLMTYQELFGQPEPLPAPPILTGSTTTLRVVDARKGELIPIPGPNTKPSDSCAKQGCADPDWATRITAIRIDKIHPHPTQPKELGFFKTEIVAECQLLEDGSLECEIPCPMTYQLRGIDKDGLVVATDHSLHVAVCGEVVTCHGCHDAHSQERLQELGNVPAEERFKHTLAGC